MRRAARPPGTTRTAPSRRTAGVRARTRPSLRRSRRWWRDDSGPEMHLRIETRPALASSISLALPLCPAPGSVPGKLPLAGAKFYFYLRGHACGFRIPGSAGRISFPVSRTSPRGPLRRPRQGRARACQGRRRQSGKATAPPDWPYFSPAHPYVAARPRRPVCLSAVDNGKRGSPRMHAFFGKRDEVPFFPPGSF